MRKHRTGGAGNRSPTLRNSRAAELNKAIDRSLEELAAALEKGESQPLRRYLAVLGRFHRYSLGNTLLIARQCPGAQQVAGFHTWRKLGRHVQHGARAIRILAPVRVKTEPTASGDSSQAIKDSDHETQPRPGQRLAGFRAASVFDISQTTGKPLPRPQRVQGDPGAYLDKLEAFIQEWGIALKRVSSLEALGAGGGGAEGVSYGGRIEIRADLGEAEACSVLIHELSHELLHHGAAAEPRPPRTVRETEAEAVACVVGEALGLTATDAAADYIQLYRGDKATLHASLERIQRTAREILDGVTANGSGTTAGTTRKAATPAAGARPPAAPAHVA